MMNINLLKSGCVAALGMVVLVSMVHAAPTYIKNTKHNLSNWGPGDIKAQDETQVCIFCHTPHNADSAVVPLWGHKDTEATVFTMASSYYAKPGNAGMGNEPTGISKKCLSCHDGTVAIGALTGGDIAMTDGVTDKLNADGTLKGPHDASHPGYIGSNLSGGHVISFVYSDVPTGPADLKTWGNISTHNQKSMFDRDRRMQCHSCHDPHTDWCDDSNNTVGQDPLWRKKCNGSGKNSSVCEVCHKTTFSGYTQAFPW